MKRREEIDDDGDRVLAVEWGEGKAMRAILTDESAFATCWVRDGSVTLGTLDAEDARALALFWADVAAELRQQQNTNGGA